MTVAEAQSKLMAEFGAAVDQAQDVVDLGVRFVGIIDLADALAARTTGTLDLDHNTGPAWTILGPVVARLGLVGSVGLKSVLERLKEALEPSAVPGRHPAPDLRDALDRRLAMLAHVDRILGARFGTWPAFQGAPTIIAISTRGLDLDRWLPGWADRLRAEVQGN